MCFLTCQEAELQKFRDYEGTIIFVSHDRHFVDEIANKILYFHDKKSYYHEGNYQDFKELEKSLFDLDQEEDHSKREDKKVYQKPKSNLSLGKLEEKISKIEEKIEKLKKSQ